MDDVPWYLQEAISFALTVLSWFEGFLSEELPPQNLWDDSEAVEEHFRRIQERKDAERGGQEVPDDSEMMDNDIASVFKR